MAVRTIPSPQSRWRTWGKTWRLDSLAYAEAGRRDLRLDFLRGLAVAIMVVDHIGGNTVLTYISGANRFIVSAAEAFVFLSGFVVGMVYGERMRRAGGWEASRGMLARAFTLYRASAGTALAFLALYFLTDARLWADRTGGLGVNGPIEAIVGVLTLRYAFDGSDVLVMYTIMIAAAPVILYLLDRRHTAQVILASFGIWAAYQWDPAVVEVPWHVVGSSFPVAAWQLLLVLGLVAGFHRDAVLRFVTGFSVRSRLALFAGGSAVYLLAWSYDRFGNLPLPASVFGDASYSSLFIKTSLGPGRVLAFLSVAILCFAIVNALWAPINGILGWFLIPLGQAALYVYITQLFVLVFLFNIMPPIVMWDAGAIDIEVFNFVAQVVALGSLWLLVRHKVLFSVIPR